MGAALDAGDGRHGRVLVDVAFLEKLPRVSVPLDELKATKGLEEMVAVERGRLSVQPGKKRESQIVVRLEGSLTNL